jgi:hypothetical protein
MGRRKKAAKKAVKKARYAAFVIFGFYLLINCSDPRFQLFSNAVTVITTRPWNALWI